jgi:hypothetical protein
MHVTGKILVWLSLPIAAGGFIMAAHLVDVRGKWMAQLQKVKKSNEDTAPLLAAARLAREQAWAELERETLRWDRYWSEKPSQYIGRNNTLIANYGSSEGITPNMMLYAFEMNKGGDSSYVGSFSVFQLQPNLTVMKPAFRVRQDDVPNWIGGNWRFRSTIPSSFTSQIAGLEADLTVADELLIKQQNNLDTQVKLVGAAKDQRDERIGELLGAAGGNANAAPQGLVAEITQADDQRNASLLEVDRLRRAISAAEKNIHRLMQENSDLARTLQSRLAPKLTALSDSTLSDTRLSGSRLSGTAP